MKLFKSLLIGFLIFTGTLKLFSQESKSDFAASIDSIINSSIQFGLFRGYPMIIVQGYPMTGSIQKENVFKILDETDIKSFETLSYDKTSQLFCTNQDGYLLIVCNR